jgi:hypothetical protein
MSSTAIETVAAPAVVAAPVAVATPARARARAPIYRTYTIKSWHQYQSIAPSHLHSIEHYNQTCEEDATLYEPHIMVLRDEVKEITGWYWCTGWPAQNCAKTDGYVDVRTGKKYSLHGEDAFSKDIIGYQ